MAVLLNPWGRFVAFHFAVFSTILRSDGYLTEKHKQPQSLRERQLEADDLSMDDNGCSD